MRSDNTPSNNKKSWLLEWFSIEKRPFTLSIIPPIFIWIYTQVIRNADSVSPFWIGLYVVLTFSLVLAYLTAIFYAFSFRLLPNLALAGAWTVLLYVLVNCFSPRSITFISLLEDAYQSGKLNSHFIEIFLKISGIGIISSMVLAIGTEITKFILNNEFHSVENKAILEKFKSNRRGLILKRTILNHSISLIHVHVVLFSFVLMAAFIAVTIACKANPTLIRINLILLAASTSVEALGIAAHFTISDDALVHAEPRYLDSVSKNVNLLIDSLPQSTDVKIDPALRRYLQVLVNTYCNHGLDRSVSQLSRFPKCANNPLLRLRLAVELIFMFDHTYTSFVEPNEEKYYINARKSFRTALAEDIVMYLLHDTGSEIGFIANLRLADRAFFEDQQSVWEQLLSTSREPYPQFRNLLLVDYLRSYFQSTYYNHSWSKEFDEKLTDKSGSCVLMLEFPYAMDICMQKRYSREAENTLTFLYDEPVPRFRDRVEEYYFHLFASQCNEYSQEDCTKIGMQFLDFLTHSYGQEERFLHRLLPINDKTYSKTQDKPTHSICWDSASPRRFMLEKESRAMYFYRELPGWHYLLEHLDAYAEAKIRCNSGTVQIFSEEKSCSDYLEYQEETPIVPITSSGECRVTNINYLRLCYFDRIADHDKDIQPGQNCCRSRKEQALALAFLIFSDGKAKGGAPIEQKSQCADAAAV